jgi:hypothetical protein
MDKKIDKIINMIRSLNEDVPVNNVSGGQIAGTSEAGDNPPVKRKKKYIYSGHGSRKTWLTHLRNGKL